MPNSWGKYFRQRRRGICDWSDAQCGKVYLYIYIFLHRWFIKMNLAQR
jgi:hypothetical protein